jgi:hypothetical protein
MNPIQLKKQYNLQLFSPRSIPTYDFSRYQAFLANALYVRLVKLLEFYPATLFYKNIGLLLDRDRLDYTREGYTFPDDSDLSFGLPVKIMNPSLKRIYGTWFNQGVGAIQLGVSGKLTIREVFIDLCKRAQQGTFQIGNVWLVEGGRLTEPYLYLSNEKGSVYTSYLSSKFFPSNRFLVSSNGGVSFKVHRV